MIVSRCDIDTLHDRLYELEAAIEDVERDLATAGRPRVADYREALEWLLRAARALTALRLGGPGDY
jgi:hypothetical protein